jgi:hypothetical protein
MGAAKKLKVSDLDQEKARTKWDYAHQAVDALWDTLQDVAGRDLQSERDAVLNALDALLAAGGVKEERG